VIIDGVLNDDGLTVFLRSPDSGHVLREKSCARFNARELSMIGGAPNYSNTFCDVFAGETNEGLTLVIESYRCYTTYSQDNVSVLNL